MRLLGPAGLAICVLTGLVTSQPAPAADVVLITTEEAKLPPPKGAIAMSARGVTRGPKVQLVPPAGAIRSPVRLQLKFQTYGGSTIDVDAVQATYLRTPNVDLTPRIKPFVNATGIDVPAAELPPGDHMVRIDIKDSDGRAATANFVLKVEP
ncbi:MAG: hypothetical protein Q7J60_11650 [Bradyrhizobium sp.]|uniref:hypothetical protein n=1 Tax=Bradyrhizobium sp. TaxID=376 RepID=UPI00271E833E|nr:hypothetical protein [Bradyrhizobium sp.]MDO9562270.1 hypothetical protein [Bradyrhizobium sp.]MDP3690747.1 hypothetical protein [Bradyrhizobium sp.]